MNGAEAWLAALERKAMAAGRGSSVHHGPVTVRLLRDGLVYKIRNRRISRVQALTTLAQRGQSA